MKLGRTPDEYKRASILKAAMQLFLKDGYSNTTMDAIAVKAHVTKQTVYAHYHNKEQLFSHIITALCEKHSPPDALLEDKGKSLETLLYEIGLSFLTMITTKEVLALTRLVIAEVGRQPKLAKGYYEGGTLRMMKMLANFLDRQKKRGLLNIGDTASAASYFLAMLKGSYHLHMIFAMKPVPSAREKEKHVRETVAIFLKIYGGAQPMHTRDRL